MEHLLRRSLRQTPDEGRAAFHSVILGELAPDEARLMALLSSGKHYPLIDVRERGRDGRALLEHVSNVGREAAVTVPELTPAYVRHLLALGLVEIGPEDSSLREQYEILDSDQAVRDAISAAGGRLGPRIFRQTLRISPLGRELVESAGDGGAGAGD